MPRRAIIVRFFRDKSNKWRFHLRSQNGRILASSEAYSNLIKAHQGAQAITKATKFKVEHVIPKSPRRGGRRS